MDSIALKSVIADGLLSFPLTDFNSEGNFNASAYVKRLEWLKPYGATALFAAGGTGEFFSLTPAEHTAVVKTAVETCKRDVPIIAGVGYSTRVAIDLAKAAERAGAAGLLVLPHYLTEADQEGIARHVEAICRSVDIGVIVYNRGVCRLGPDVLARLADCCSNLIGFKDGIGDIELMTIIRRKLGDRFAYLGGLPTAEVYSSAYRAIGVPVYSSAVFNFIPKTAMEFFFALKANDAATTNRLLDEFFIPYLAIRNRRAGYAVSIVKAGATIVGRSAGPVRPPLVDCTAAEVEMLRALVEKLGPQ
jgi:5-dehydro-4-deoxyglucarate dehydratase